MGIRACFLAQMCDFLGSPEKKSGGSERRQRILNKAKAIGAKFKLIITRKQKVKTEKEMIEEKHRKDAEQLAVEKEKTMAKFKKFTKDALLGIPPLI